MSKEQKKSVKKSSEKLTSKVSSKDKKDATTLQKPNPATAKTATAKAATIKPTTDKAATVKVEAAKISASKAAAVKSVTAKSKKNAQASADLDDSNATSKNKFTDINFAQEYTQETRTHHEGLGDQWYVLVGNPTRMMSQIVGTVIKSGGTREVWQSKSAGKEYVMLAWPADQPLRAAVVISGDIDGDLKPITATPLLEGLPNDLEVDSVHAWENKAAANIAVMVEEGRNPLWMYTPVYFRDREALTPGVTHTFLVAGLAYNLRHALLDNITITQGPQFEQYAKVWLAENEGKKSLDVPPIQLNIAGASIITPGNNYCEYQIRCPIVSVGKTKLDKADAYMLHLRFEFKARAPLDIMVYVPVTVCADGYVPKQGDEVDAYIWLQGRIIDHE